MPTRIDTAEVRKLGREFAKAAAESPKQIRQAVGSIRRAANTETKREIAGVYNLTQGRIAQDLDVSSGDLLVSITGGKRPILATRYKGTRQTKGGLRLQVLRSSAPTVLRRGFISKTRKLPFARRGAPRLPIDAIYGPSVADMLANKKIQTGLTGRLTARAVRELSRRLARIRG